MIRFLKAERGSLGNPGKSFNFLPSYIFNTSLIYQGYERQLSYLDRNICGPTFEASDWIAREFMDKYLHNVFYWKRTKTWEESVEDLLKLKNHHKQGTDNGLYEKIFF